jgi:hypothetical protein
MSRVIRNGEPVDIVPVDRDLLNDDVWVKYPKLLNIWLHIQSNRSVSYGSIAAKLKISKTAVGQHIKRLKNLKFADGSPLIEVTSSFNSETKTKKSVYIVTTGFNNNPLMKEYNLTEENIKDLMYSEEPVEKHMQQIMSNPSSATIKGIYDKANDDCEGVKCGSLDKCFGCTHAY